MVSSLKKAFEADGTPCLKTQSSNSEDGLAAALLEESTSHCLDVNMNRISTASGSSHTERVVQEIVLTEQAYVSHLQEIIEVHLMANNFVNCDIVFNPFYSFTHRG